MTLSPSLTQLRGLRGALLTTGLLAAATAQAASPAEIQNGWNSLAGDLGSIVSGDFANKLRTAHEKLRDYQWRTVYELTRVPKDPLPGTRLAVQPMPNMSQLDAETYLNSLPDLQKIGGIPAMNCPVAKMGGPAGRSISFTVPPSTAQITLSDAQLRALFMKASPDKGEAAYQAFIAFRDAACPAIYNVAQLSFRLQKYRDLQANWKECSENGVQISSWSVREKFGFKGGISRTVQAGGGVLYKCGAVASGKPEDAIGYDSWFKWSDDSPVPLNLWQMIKDAKDSPNECPRACIPVVGGGSLSASLCMGLDPGISAAGSTLPMKMGVRFRYRSRDKDLCTPVINVPAPFGMAESLGEMAESGKQQMTQQLQSQLMDLLPIDNSTMNKIKQLAALAR